MCHLILLLELSIWKTEVSHNSPVPSSGCVVEIVWSLWLDIWAPWQLMSRMNENIISSISNILIVVCWPRGKYRKYKKLNLLSPRCFLILIFNFLCLNKRIHLAPCVTPLTNWIKIVKCLHVLWCDKGIDKISIQNFKTQISHHSPHFAENLDCASESFL